MPSGSSFFVVNLIPGAKAAGSAMVLPMRISQHDRQHHRLKGMPAAAKGKGSERQVAYPDGGDRDEDRKADAPAVAGELQLGDLGRARQLGGHSSSFGSTDLNRTTHTHGLFSHAKSVRP